MKPFALDTVLDYRQRLEDIAKNRLAEARQAQRKAQAEFKATQKLYTGLVDTIERVQREGVSINELIQHEEHLRYVKQELNRLRDILAARQKTVLSRQQELIKKSRERQVLAKLKERQNSAYRQYLNKKEAAVLDEIAILYYNK